MLWKHIHQHAEINVEVRCLVYDELIAQWRERVAENRAREEAARARGEAARAQEAARHQEEARAREEAENSHMRSIADLIADMDRWRNEGSGSRLQQAPDQQPPIRRWSR